MLCRVELPLYFRGARKTARRAHSETNRYKHSKSLKGFNSHTYCFPRVALKSPVE